MRYPSDLRVIVDVTKPPYCADNTGKTDCTEALRRAYNDLMLEDVAAVRRTMDKIKSAPKEQNNYFGFQSRLTREGKLNVSYSEDLPAAKILYFPNGTYLVSDTIIYETRESRKFYKDRWSFELNRNIHFEGESREGAIIRLADHAKGFEYGQIRPIISFILRPETVAEHIANNAMLNTVKDLTIDCGRGNGGAVGIKYYANNSGRIENVTVKSSDEAFDGFAGILLSGESVGVFNDLRIDGFDYGVLILNGERELYERVTFANQRICGIYAKHVSGVFKDIRNEGSVPTFKADAHTYTAASFLNVEGDVLTGENFVYNDKLGKTPYPKIRLLGAKNEKQTLGLPILDAPTFTYPAPEEWVCVNHFGAVGDGETDDTAAIQAAMNSGAEVIYFNQGRYRIEDEILIPKTVRIVNFCFCDMVAGQRLREGRELGAFVIAEDSDAPLLLTNAFTWEKFCGLFHFVRHSAKRDLVLKDLHLQTACVYRNTVPGSRVFLDDVACTTGDFSEWYFYRREGEEPIYASNIPFEFHGQQVFGRNLNPERADLEIVNDGGEAVFLGIYVEGPGTLLQTLNGGKSEIYTFVAAAGTDNPEKPVLLNENSNVSAVAGFLYGAPRVYPVVVREIRGKMGAFFYFEELPRKDSITRFLASYVGELIE